MTVIISEARARTFSRMDSEVRIGAAVTGAWVNAGYLSTMFRLFTRA
jgi:hypothetical protein